jgi:hypothetical protein
VITDFPTIIPAGQRHIVHERFWRMADPLVSDLEAWSKSARTAKSVGGGNLFLVCMEYTSKLLGAHGEILRGWLRNAKPIVDHGGVALIRAEASDICHRFIEETLNFFDDHKEYVELEEEAEYLRRELSNRMRDEKDEYLEALTDLMRPVVSTSLAPPADTVVQAGCFDESGVSHVISVCNASGREHCVLDGHYIALTADRAYVLYAIVKAGGGRLRFANLKSDPRTEGAPQKLFAALPPEVRKLCETRKGRAGGVWLRVQQAGAK